MHLVNPVLVAWVAVGLCACAGPGTAARPVTAAHAGGQVEQRLAAGRELSFDVMAPCKGAARTCEGWRRPRVSAECVGRVDVPPGLAETAVRFVVGIDGRADEFQIPSHAARASGSIQDWLGACRFDPARAPDGIPTAATVVLPLSLGPQRRCGQEEPGAASTSSSWPRAVSRRPAPRDPACIGAHLRLPTGPRPAMMTFRFDVLANGTPTGLTTVEAEELISDEVFCAVWDAVRKCEWSPGLDASGTPVAMPMILPLR